MGGLTSDEEAEDEADEDVEVALRAQVGEGTRLKRRLVPPTPIATHHIHILCVVRPPDQLPVYFEDERRMKGRGTIC